ncbi:MAG: DUF5004 domain-containing protein [Cytophagales bacterium]
MRNLLLLTIISSLFIACGDDDSGSTPGASKSKTELLTEGKWQITAMTIAPAVDLGGGNLVTDFYNNFLEECDRDDLLNWNADGTYAHEEGAISCDSAGTGGEVYDEGDWSFNASETVLTEISNDGDTSTFTIVSITSSQIVATVIEEFDTTEHTITATLIKQ